VTTWFPWVLTTIALMGAWRLTVGCRSGWVIGLFLQLLWAFYAARTAQWGFLASSAAFGAMDILGLWSWRKASTRPDTGPPDQPQRFGLRRRRAD